jgi:DNA-directed RNA polymerase subunit H (RpoH/RPB5)
VFAQSRSEKKTIEEVNQEDLFKNLKEISNILPKILASRPNVIPIQTENKPILNQVKKEDDPLLKFKSLFPEDVIKVTRAERQVNFDVASLSRADEAEPVRIETTTGEVEEAEDVADNEVEGLGFGEEEDYE